MAASPLVQAVTISYCLESCFTLTLTNSKTKDSTSIINTWINIVFTGSLLDFQQPDSWIFLLLYEPTQKLLVFKENIWAN
jgi:hypothetical protein